MAEDDTDRDVAEESTRSQRDAFLPRYDVLLHELKTPLSSTLLSADSMRLHIDSHPRRGATFSLALPTVPSAPGAAGDGRR